MTFAKGKTPDSRLRTWIIVVVVCLTVFHESNRLCWADNGAKLEKQATWKWPESSSFQQHLLSFIEQRAVSTEQRGQIQSAWNDSKDTDQGPEFLQRLLSASSIAEPRIAELMRLLNDPQAAPVIPSQIEWLASDIPGWLQDAVRLACGRTLAQRRLYDEANEALSGLELDQVCDPASLIFYRAVCEHHLLQKKECLANLKKLLERERELPVRYAQVSNLMLADIEPLKADSLDEIARLMNDVQRRLDLGRAGKRVRDEEQEIVSKLDKMIDKIEQQIKQAQQQQQQQNGGKQNQPKNPGQPLDDSRIAGGTGPGDVDKKDLSNRSGWGNLPPAQRQEALQRLTEELPSHYREVIEGYFRRLAMDKE